MSEKVRVRIAPSPTGHLHLGTARTALYNYLYAKRHGGTFVFRLEDTDEERSRESFTEDIIAGLKWLGIAWDEGPDIGGPFAPYRQTEKLDHYNDFAKKLIDKGLAYYAYETPEELAALKEAQKAENKAPRYDNSHRNLTPELIEKYIEEGRVPSIRFRIEEPHVVSWNDGIKGEIKIEASDLGGDMVIVKSNGVAIYNFAVVVDDVDMEMTQVIRGEDHIHNTAKQILLYEALGYKMPEFAHAPLIFDMEHRKLSKRHHGEAVHIDKYRIDGYMPEAMVNYLAHMSWTTVDDKELFTLEEAGELFDLSRVSKSPAVFDIQKLQWFNGHYIRSLPLATIVERSLPYFGHIDISGYSTEEFQQVVATVRDGLSMLSEIYGAAAFYFVPKIEIDAELKEKALSKDNAKTVLTEILKNLNQLPFGDHAGCKLVVDSLGKELGMKGKDLYWPLRASLSGKVQGPDLGSIISILGAERVKARLEDTLSLCPCA
ncbi:MAG: glutamate--tRNA ligase [Leptolyngbya sp.]|nr:glutamate--tRNA ligase [Candidatus Melainabacteria bacterium]